MGASSVSKSVECIPEIIILSSCPDAAQQVYIGEPLPVQVQWGHGMVSSAPFKDDSTLREETGGPEAKRWKSLWEVIPVAKANNIWHCVKMLFNTQSSPCTHLLFSILNFWGDIPLLLFISLSGPWKLVKCPWISVQGDTWRNFHPKVK